MVRLTMALLTLMLSVSPARAQLIPPIYTPLPDSTLASYQAEATRLRQHAADLEIRAASLRQSATVSATRGVDVTALEAQVAELTREMELQERTRTSEATRAEVLQGQVDQLRAAAATARAREAELLAAIDSIRSLPPPPVAEPDSAGGLVPPDSILYPIVLPSTATLDSGVVAVRREATLHTSRADTLAIQATAAQQASEAAAARIRTLQTLRTVLTDAVRQANQSGASGAETAGLLVREAERLDQERANALAAASRQEMQEQEARVRPRQGFFPVRNDEEAGRFFGEEQSVQALQNMVAAFADEVGAGSVNTEIASDYKWGTRISANVIVARAEEDLKEEEGTTTEGETDLTRDADAIRRLVAGGGTFNLIAMRPLFYIGNGLDGATIHLVPKFGADMPDDGAPIHGELALLFNGKFQTINQVFQFFGSLKTSGIFGNQRFGEMMGIEAGKSFAYAQYLVGVEVASAVKLLFSGSMGPGAIGRTGALSIQISPN